MSVIEIEDLSRSFVNPDGERREVVRVKRFRLEEGEQMALEGASGSGKTTFLHLIAGILAADRGNIRLAGHDLTQASEAERDRIRAHSLGYVFQNFNLLHGFSALENVLLAMAFGAGPDPRWARTLLDRVGLSDRMNHRPAQLSVGQQQRVALARALANRPRLVLADEPTANLDAPRAKEAVSLLREVVSEVGAGLLLVSHDPAVLEQFPRRRALSEINAVEVA